MEKYAENIGELKFVCVKGFLHKNFDLERFEKLSAVEWRAFTNDLDFRGLSPLVWKCLSPYWSRLNIPQEIRDRLEKIHYQSAARGTILFHQAANLIRALNYNKIVFILLKGVYFSESLYRDISIRPMSDIDILVNKADLNSVESCLKECGYYPSTANTAFILGDKHLIFLTKGIDLPVELHYIQGANYIPAVREFAQIKDRALEITAAGERTLTLSPEDSLLYVCYHITKHQYGRYTIRDLVDIGMILNHFKQGLDWEYIHKNAEEWKIDNHVYTCFSLAKELLDANISEHSLNIIKPENYNCEILEWLKRRLTEDASKELIKSSNIGKILWEKGFGAKLKIFFKRCFSSESITAEYNLDPNSAKVYLYYFVRLKALIKRHTSSILKVLISKTRADSEKKRFIESQKFIDIIDLWQRQTVNH